jgi:hypothetical protein
MSPTIASEIRKALTMLFISKPPSSRGLLLSIALFASLLEHHKSFAALFQLARFSPPTADARLAVGSEIRED